MRRIIILLVCVLAVCLMAGSIHAATICIDNIGYCNDVKLTYSDQEGSIIDAYGYEYGCGYNDRLVSGSIHLVGNTAYIGLTGAANSAAAPNPTLMVKVYTINISTMTGTEAWSYNNGAYWNGTSNVTVSSCSPTENPVANLNDPDASVR